MSAPSVAPVHVMGKKKENNVSPEVKEFCKKKKTQLNEKVISSIAKKLEEIVGSPIDVLVKWESFKDNIDTIKSLHIFLTKLPPLFEELCSTEAGKNAVETIVSKIFVTQSKLETASDVFHNPHVNPTLSTGVLTFQYNFRGGRFPASIPADDVRSLLDAQMKSEEGAPGLWEVAKLKYITEELFPSVGTKISESLGAEEIAIDADWSALKDRVIAASLDGSDNFLVPEDPSVGRMVPVYDNIIQFVEELPDVFAKLGSDSGVRSEFNKNVGRIVIGGHACPADISKVKPAVVEGEFIFTYDFVQGHFPKPLTAEHITAVFADNESAGFNWKKPLFILILLGLMFLHVGVCIIEGYFGYLGGGIAYLMTVACVIAIFLPIIAIIGFFGKSGKFLLYYMFGLALVIVMNSMGGILSLVFFSSEDQYLQNCKEYESAAACGGDNADRRRFFAMMGGFISFIAFVLFILEVVVGVFLRKSIVEETAAEEENN